MSPMDVRNRTAAVIGAGRSGQAAAELLSRQGASVLLSEHGVLAESVARRFRDLGIAVESGGHTAAVLAADFAVLSPGIPPQAQVVRDLAARLVPIYSEIEVASWFCRARIAGITGTDGKTTTATLVHHIFAADGLERGYRSFSVGNIGIPFSSLADSMEAADVAVVELSSYQLERCQSFHPEAALITNITPDHLDRYGGELSGYAEAKFRITMNQGVGDTLVYNGDDPILSARFPRSGEPFRAVPFSMQPPLPGNAAPSGVFLIGEEIVTFATGGWESVARTGEFLKDGFRGRHNIANALAAVALTGAMGIPARVARGVLEGFRGVEHRQEFVRRIDGCNWINDSKATNLNAMLQALESASAPVVLIAGGRDKGNDYPSIMQTVLRQVACIVAIGESQERLAAAFCGTIPVLRASSLEDAVRAARRASRPGGTVLFSPGCASFDMFTDFEERGRKFKECVKALEP